MRVTQSCLVTVRTHMYVHEVWLLNNKTLLTLLSTCYPFKVTATGRHTHSAPHQTSKHPPQVNLWECFKQIRRFFHTNHDDRSLKFHKKRNVHPLLNSITRYGRRNLMSRYKNYWYSTLRTLNGAWFRTQWGKLSSNQYVLALAIRRTSREQKVKPRYLIIRSCTSITYHTRYIQSITYHTGYIRSTHILPQIILASTWT